MSDEFDIAMTQGPDGKSLLHRVDCPQARAMAERGEPVFTMYGCKGKMPADMARHECLTDDPNMR